MQSPRHACGGRGGGPVYSVRPTVLTVSVLWTSWRWRGWGGGWGGKRRTGRGGSYRAIIRLVFFTQKHLLPRDNSCLRVIVGREEVEVIPHDVVVSFIHTLQVPGQVANTAVPTVHLTEILSWRAQAWGGERRQDHEEVYVSLLVSEEKQRESEDVTCAV